jgi:threonine aldolase
MNFASDNAYGVLPQIMAALGREAGGTAAPYGEDAVTARLTQRFCELFEREVAVFPVISGTAANALALACLTPPHGAVLCHQGSHIMGHECGAPEFFTHGAKLIGLPSVNEPGADGKLTPDGLAAALAGMERGFVHSVQPFVISLSQASELGTVYDRHELAGIAALARREGLKLHLDGARFANAMAHLGVTPAEATWKSGVDVLSFGASKGGALAAEAVIFFDPKLAGDFEYRRKKSGHLISKLRFVSAQLEAFVEGGLWLESAGHANRLAARLGKGLQKLPGVELVAPVQTNMVFARIAEATAARLRKAGAIFYDWEPPQSGKVVVRLATSFATTEEEVAKFLELAAA